MLPALPTGMHSTSGASPRSSQISKAPVRCPSMRYSLSELTRAMLWRSTSWRTTTRASSKLPSRASTRAPCASAWASLPAAILPSGMTTAAVSPARAA